MKALTYFLFLACYASFAQNTASNKPGLAKCILDDYIGLAEARGIEVRERVYAITEIIFLPGGDNSHEHRLNKCVIRIDSDKYKTSYEIERAAFHEIGHHLGLAHCLECSYNVMAELQDGKAVYLYENEAIRSLYLDIYFEAIRNPKKYNEGHTHY